MKRQFMGRTGIEVSELCFGALPIGPLQANISIDEGAQLIRIALENGINFIDTAETYKTYPYIKKSLQGFKGEVIIATKSPATTYEAMEKSILSVLDALDRDYLDIFLMHAARATPAVFEERAGAFQCLQDYKSKGVLRAIGISTHAVSVVNKAAELDEIDVVFPIINKLGMGIIDGSTDDMISAISKAGDSGKGIYAMKALAGGHLIDQLKQSFDFVRNIKPISSIAVGMLTPKELELNLKLFNGEDVDEELMPNKANCSKKLMISVFCKGCGTCVDACPNNALSIKNGKAAVDRQRCILCGYCNPVCPEFAIRLI